MNDLTKLEAKNCKIAKKNTTESKFLFGHCVNLYLNGLIRFV